MIKSCGDSSDILYEEQISSVSIPPLVHITASKGSSPGPCALRVRRVNLTHKVISVKIFTLSLYGRLSLDANLVSFFDRFCGFWKLNQFPRMQKILWNKIRSFERHASMFWKYFALSKTPLHIDRYGCLANIVWTCLWPRT